MEKVARHYDKIILTLIMCLVILFMATFTPFAQPANAVAIIDDAIIAIIIAGLAAIGITFVTTGSFFTLEDYVQSLFNEYAEDNNTTVDALLKGTQSGTDKLGRLLINNRFVVLISTFGAWIKAKYNLTNNSVHNLVSEGYDLGNLVVYENMIRLPAGSGYYDVLIYTNGTLALIVDSNNPSNCSLCVISENPSVQCNNTRYRNDGSLVWSDTSTVNLVHNGNYQGITINSELYWAYTGTVRTSDINNYSDLVINTKQDFADALNSADGLDYNNIGIDIVTGDITLPLDDSNYTDGDGAVIDVDADWGLTYTDVTEDVIPDAFSDSKEGDASIDYVAEEEVAEAVEDTSEITNLPAGTIPFTPLQLPQFHLVDIWHYVAQWIEDTAVAAGALMAIVVQEPHPMVNLFYATVCLAIIFGVIKGFAK